MGQNKSKGSAFPREYEDLQYLTHFTVEEIKKLYDNFKSISSSIVADGVIDQLEFQTALGLRDSEFSNRVFRIFDENNDRVITFREFVLGLSVLCQRGSEEEKLKLSFKIYDVDGDGYIDKEELFGMLRATLGEKYLLHFTEDQMRQLVDQTFQETDLNSDGRISFDEYKTMVQSHPTIIENLTIDHMVFTQ